MYCRFFYTLVELFFLHFLLMQALLKLFLPSLVIMPFFNPYHALPKFLMNLFCRFISCQNWHIVQYFWKFFLPKTKILCQFKLMMVLREYWFIIICIWYIFMICCLSIKRTCWFKCTKYVWLGEGVVLRTDTNVFQVWYLLNKQKKF